MVRKKIAALLSAFAVSLTMAAAPVSEQYLTTEISAYAAAGDTDNLSQYANEVFTLVNKERAAKGLSPLKLSGELSKAANVRAKEIQTTFSHTRPDGRSCFTAIKEAGISYTYAAENIAYGQKTPEAVMKSWMNSSGHKANILNTKADYIGIGVAYKNGRYYWTQFFAKGKGMTSDTTAKTTADTKKVTTEKTTTKTDNKTVIKTDCTGTNCGNVSKNACTDILLQLLKKASCKSCK